MNQTNKKLILVVEDDSDSRMAICTILESLGYDHISFSGGQEALDGIQDAKIDLALLDIMMPGMNGYELLQKLREIESLKHTPMFMVTAKDQDNEIIEGFNYGADYYITKPFNTKQLEYGIKLFLV